MSVTNFNELHVDKLLVGGKEVGSSSASAIPSVAPIKLSGDMEKDLKAIAAKQNEIIAALKLAGIMENK